MQRRMTAISLATATAAIAASLIAAPGAGAAPATKDVQNTLPRWVEKVKSAGRASAAAPVNVRIYLAPNGGVDALKSAVAAVSTPGSPSYRAFLSASDFHNRYDPSTSTVKAVSSWLRQNRFTVTGVESHRRYVSAHGTVAAAQKAFGAGINRYTHKGRQVQANSAPLKVPAALAPSILTISGVDTTPRLVKHSSAPPPPGFANARPCSHSYGQVLANKQADHTTPLPKFRGETLPYAVCGYTGPQLRAAYEDSLSAGTDGSGATVAITDAYAAPTIVADTNRYAKRHGDGAYEHGQLTQVLPDSFNSEDICDASGWYGEETLDIEAVHAMAPGAKIRYYASPSCFDTDFLTTLEKVVDENKASIVTNSWSDVEANESADNIAAYEQVFLQGAMQGISFMFSSGDNGDELANTGLKQTDYPASDPYVTAVGGTSDAIGADGSFDFQTGWGTNRYDLNTAETAWVFTTFMYGAGGGSSALFDRPAYQEGVVPPKAGSGRAVPDVGLDADPTTGMLIGETQTFPDGVRYGEFRIGGTSLASPLFAGMTANLTEHAGDRIGFLNPKIYRQADSEVFTDIQGTPPDAGNVRVDFVNGVDDADGLRYTVRTFNEDSSLRIASGWDNVTGVGSPNARWITSIND